MEQLVELLKQIQELAGVGIDALKEAGGSGGGAAAEAPNGGEGGNETPPEQPTS